MADRFRQAPVSGYRFGAFELDTESQELRRSGVKLPLRPQSYAVLLMLIEAGGRLVSREDLIERLWAKDEIYVDFDLGLNSAIRRLREVLRDDAKAPRFIETVPRRGYRLVVGVEPLAPTSIESAVRTGRGTTNRLVSSLGAVVAVTLGLAAGWLASRAPRPQPPAAAEVVLAVTPFLTSSATQDHLFLGDALAQEILVHLGDLRASELKLLGWQSASDLSLSDDPGRRRAQELGADYVLSGSVISSPTETRIVSLLQRSSDGGHLWGETTDHEAGSPALVIADAARSISAAVATELRLSGSSAGLAPVRADAYELYLRGLYLLEKSDPEQLAKSAELFEQASTLEPTFARAFEALALARFRMVSSPHQRRSTWEDVRQAALQALALDDSLGHAHALLGVHKLYKDWDFAGAGESMRRAVALEPSAGRVQSFYSAYLLVTGHLDEALARARLARRLDPQRLGVRADLCWYLLTAGRAEEAIAECGYALELKPDDQWSHFGLAEAYRGLGQDAKAISHAASALQIDEPALLTEDATVRSFWQVVEERLPDQPAPGPSAYLAAVACALAGDAECSFGWLEAAYQHRDPLLLYLHADPRFEELRADDRYGLLTRRIGLPELVAAAADGLDSSFSP